MPKLYLLSIEGESVDVVPVQISGTITVDGKTYGLLAQPSAAIPAPPAVSIDTKPTRSLKSGVAYHHAEQALRNAGEGGLSGHDLRVFLEDHGVPPGVTIPTISVLSRAKQIKRLPGGNWTLASMVSNIQAE